MAGGQTSDRALAKFWEPLDCTNRPVQNRQKQKDREAIDTYSCWSAKHFITYVHILPCFLSFSTVILVFRGFHQRNQIKHFLFSRLNIIFNPTCIYILTLMTELCSCRYSSFWFLNGTYDSQLQEPLCELASVTLPLLAWHQDFTVGSTLADIVLFFFLLLLCLNLLNDFLGQILLAVQQSRPHLILGHFHYLNLWY